MALDSRIMELIRQASATYSWDDEPDEAGAVLVQPIHTSDAGAQPGECAAGTETVVSILSDRVANLDWQKSDWPGSQRRTLVYRNDPARAAISDSGSSSSPDPEMAGRDALDKLLDNAVLDLEDLGVDIWFVVERNDMRKVASQLRVLAGGFETMADLDDAEATAAKPRYRTAARVRIGNVVPFVRPV